MKLSKYYIPALSLLTLLSGCSSNNIKTFRADPLVKHDLPISSFGKIHITNVSMPEGDTNSIMCRAVGNIYLPEKMTYSVYIKEAFKKTLLVLDKYAEATEEGHKLNIQLDKVTFDTLAGEWIIDAKVSVDGKPSIVVNSVSQYGTAYIAETACRNTAEAFDIAAGAFVKKVLTTPEVLKDLR